MSTASVIRLASNEAEKQSANVLTTAITTIDNDAIATSTFHPILRERIELCGEKVAAQNPVQINKTIFCMSAPVVPDRGGRAERPRAIEMLSWRAEARPRWSTD